MEHVPCESLLGVQVVDVYVEVFVRQLERKRVVIVTLGKGSQSLGHRLVPIDGLLGTGPHSRR